jgi:phenylpropionate dioxygenase-like ring-hydroxylating dioxygenase large terminal subunit
MSPSKTRRMTPPATKEHTSVAVVRDDWYVVCQAGELSTRPIARTLTGVPLVLFRDARGEPAALLDRCPHRNAPLSLGRVEGARLECGYHGWQFDRSGTCRRVPGLCGEHEGRGRRVASFPCREQDGLVWVYATPDVEPERDPFRFPHLDDPRYTTVRETFDMEGTVHAVAENALDVPHTAFLHRGLFRGTREPKTIDVVVRRWHDRVEAEYIGEPRPSGLIGRMASPKADVVEHFDRFILPSIGQVEYRLGERNHLCISIALTPVTDFHTRMFAVVTFRLPVPGWTVAPAVKPVAMRVLAQDARILRAQTNVIQSFGGEQFMSTEIDALGPHILRLLRNAERGDRTPVGEPTVKKLQMQV